MWSRLSNGVLLLIVRHWGNGRPGGVKARATSADVAYSASSSAKTI